MTDYATFLEQKRLVSPPVGVRVVPTLSSQLFPFQRDIVAWALRRGRAAIFADCGLGKTAMQLEWAKHLQGDVLIVTPLAVAQQTRAEAHKFGVRVGVAQRASGITERITVTNYERLDAFDPSRFTGVVLDESSILKSYDGATRTALIEMFGRTPYRLACTATPAPNDHMELGNHAEFLGILSRAEMLALFFTHDGGETQTWRIKRHGRAAFWMWVASWAAVMRSPADLGYAMDGFQLPPLMIHEHILPSTMESTQDRGLLIPLPARDLTERRDARRASLNDRVAAAIALVDREPSEPWLLWCDFNAEGDALTRGIPAAVQVAGTDDSDIKVDRLLGFAQGRYRVLVTKPTIAGFGMNWQHCARVCFVGLSDSYEQFYQAIRRCWRFGQTRPVEVHIITSESEGSIVQNIHRKEAQATEMHAEMAGETKDAVRANVQGAERQQMDYVRHSREEDGWTLHLGDCVDVVRDMPTASVDYTIFSPPFASLYTYTDSDRDMGNSTDDATFLHHFGFLVRDLMRVTRPGRLLSFHCMNLPTSKVRDGVIGLKDFRGELIRLFTEAGWIYHSEVVIWKDPVTAMQRTKAIGLLYKQLKKDATLSRQGIPDYLVTMRAPGVNDSPVTHSPADLPLPLWQRYASPIWTDINPSDTLQFRTARESNDERHICPLQLQVIDRAIHLWSNPGDTILSPFAGIGSEGYVAVGAGRSFIGVELKRSYWELACHNLERAARETNDALSLFAQAVE